MTKSQKIRAAGVVRGLPICRPECRAGGILDDFRQEEELKMRITFLNGRESIEVDKYQLAGMHLSYADLSLCDLQYCDLQDCDLRGAKLQDCDLRGANLQDCDLRDANLRGANLDYASITLSCHLLNANIDKRLAVQLLYHACRWLQSVDDDECREFLQLEHVKKLANKFHRVNECGEI